MSQKLKQLKEKLRRAIREELVEYDNLNVQSEEEDELEEASMTGNLDGGEGPPKTPYAFQSKKKRAQDKKKEDEIVTNSTGFIKVNEAVEQGELISAIQQIEAGLDEAEYGFRALKDLSGMSSREHGLVIKLQRVFLNLMKGVQNASRKIKTESINEARRLTKGNRGVKVGDTVRFRDEHRRPVSQRVKVKWIMKAKPNKEFVDFSYITNKGTFHDQHLQGTKAWKLYYSKPTEVRINEAKGWDLLNNIFLKFTKHQVRRLELAIKKKDIKRTNQLVDLIIGGLSAAKKSTTNRKGFKYESINEGRYHTWRNDESLSPKQKIGRSMREVRDSLNSLSKTIDMSVKLKNELKVNSSDYWKTTHKALGKISERLVKLANKVGKLQ